MTVLATTMPNMRAIFGDVIARLLDGDMKDKKNPNGWNYVEELARQMLLDPKKAAELIAKASARDCLPGIKASVERAAALNAPKLALLATAERCKTRGSIYESAAALNFRRDLPHRLYRLHHSTDEDPRYDEHVYMPLNRDGAPLGEEAWHFRRDPNEVGVLIDDDLHAVCGWPPGGKRYLYVTEDL
jgi:hypothetical protein